MKTKYGETVANGFVRAAVNKEQLEKRKLLTAISFIPHEVVQAENSTSAAVVTRDMGDVNDDGTVEFADFLALSANFGATDAAWADGDLDLDGKVDFTDFLLLSANFGSTK